MNISTQWCADMSDMSPSVRLTFTEPVNLVGIFYYNTAYLSLTYGNSSDVNVTYMTYKTYINVDKNSVRSLITEVMNLKRK